MMTGGTACNCPEHGGQQQHNTGCPVGGWRLTQTIPTSSDMNPSMCRHDIAAIEAEAVADERARIATAVRDLLPWSDVSALDVETVAGDVINAVLAIVDPRP